MDCEKRRNASRSNVLEASFITKESLVYLLLDQRFRPLIAGVLLGVALGCSLCKFQSKSNPGLLVLGTSGHQSAGQSHGNSNQVVMGGMNRPVHLFR